MLVEQVGKTADLDVYNCLTGGVSGTDLLPDGDDPFAYLQYFKRLLMKNLDFYMVLN